MTRYEYRRLDSGATPHPLKDLNELGALGFKVVSTDTRSRADPAYLLMREIVEEAKIELTGRE